MREFVCGLFSLCTNFACKHLPAFHASESCRTLPSKIWYSEVDDCAAKMLVLSTEGSHSVNGRSDEHMLSSLVTRSWIKLSICVCSECLSLEKVVSESKFRQAFAPVVVPPMHGSHNWNHHFQLPEQGRGCVSFTADTSNDVHVAVSTHPESMDPMYEFVVGGWDNTRSVMRRRSQGPVLCTVPIGLKKPLPGAVSDLWISVDKKTQLIQVGYGTHPSLESMFCVYKDPQFLWKAQFIGFTTWNAPATYSNIKVSAME